MEIGGGSLSTLPDRFCAICFSQGREGRLITNPYCGECGHVYCYTCVVGQVAGEEGDGWGCLRCGRVIKHVKRWEEVVEGETSVAEMTDGIEGHPDGEGEEGEDTSQSEEILTPEEEDEVDDEGGSDEEENLFG